MDRNDYYEHEYFDDGSLDEHDFCYHTMTRREQLAAWLWHRKMGLQRLYWRIKWHNRCETCGCDTNNGFIYCEKHEIPFRFHRRPPSL